MAVHFTPNRREGIRFDVPIAWLDTVMPALTGPEWGTFLTLFGVCMKIPSDGEFGEGHIRQAAVLYGHPIAILKSLIAKGEVADWGAGKYYLIRWPESQTSIASRAQTKSVRSQINHNHYEKTKADKKELEQLRKATDDPPPIIGRRRA